MDNSTIKAQLDMVLSHYPKINIEQLGLVCIMLAAIRVTLGHESVKGTIENYVHPSQLSKDVRLCLDFLEREILAIKCSKIDVDYWKFGKKENLGEIWIRKK